jgi:Skp family chaperone for outer membrane proteins
MRVLTLATAFGLSVLALPAAQTTTPGQAPAGQTEPVPPAQAVPARPPFPVGAKFAFVDLQRVFAESVEGQAANARVQELSEQKLAEIEEKNTMLQASQQKLAQGLTVLSPDVRLQLQRDIDKMLLDIERFSQDADVEVGALQQTLQIEFQQKLLPVIDRVANEKQLDFIFSVADSGLVWAAPSLDVTEEIIRQFDASGSPPPPAAAASSSSSPPPER